MAKPSRASEVLGLLRSAVPTSHPVMLVWVWSIPESHADCDLVVKDGRKRFILRLERDLTEPAMEWALIHEYAHAVCWDYVVRIGEKHDHPPEYWLAYGRCWDANYGVRA